MNRSHFLCSWRRRLASSGVGFVLLFVSGCRRNEEGAPSARAPRDANVVLITLDTTRADHLSCYSEHAAVRNQGFHGAKTPHLDALAARGVRFAHATAQAPLTLPSHASIMTGEYPTLHGLRDMGGFVLEKFHPTIASITQGNGYATAAFVGSRAVARSFGLSTGFATYDDNMGSQHDERMLPGIYPERRAEVVTDRALEWIRANGDKKFFLWAHYYDPHAPYDPPEPYKHTYARDLYSGEIAYVDEQVGRLLDGLEQMGLQSRTLVAAIGDHGESLGEHGEMTHGVFLYDATLHVPLVIAGPDVPRGKVVENQVRSIDVMPTLLNFLNLPPGSEVQGVSLWPLILHGTRLRSNYSYAETLYPRIHLGWSELRAMRTDTWKLIVAPHPELYNLEHDPDEVKNVISNFPADSDQLQKKIWEIAGNQSRQEKVVTSPIDTQTRQELESLGYVSAGTWGEIKLGTKAADPKDRIEVLRLLEQTEKLLTAKAYLRVAQLMEAGLRRDPPNPRCHIYLALAYEEMGQYQRAVQGLKHAVDLKLGTDIIYARLGLDYLHLHQLGKALEAMARANQLNPTDLDNWRNLGSAYLQLGRVDDAEKIFKAIIVQNNRYAAAFNGLGLGAIQRGDTEAARRHFEKALEVNPDEVEPLLNLGILYQKTGNREQALHYLQLFLKKAPHGQFNPNS